MSPLRFLISAMVGLSILPTALTAQDAVPKHRFVHAKDFDFAGTDLGNLFDTSEASCVRACLAQDNCVAFTYNSYSNACFPKSGVSSGEPYDGARSGIKITTPPDVLQRAAQRQVAIPFMSASDAKAAADFTQEIAARTAVSGAKLTELIVAMKSGEIWSPSDASTLGLSDRADLWTQRAEDLLRTAKSPDGRRAREARRDALSAAYNGYLRAPDDAQQADALNILAKVLEENRRGRDMVPALRLASTLSNRGDIAAALDDAVGKYGFRITEHRVDSDAAAPRICAEFSEDLVPVGLDYEPFVQLSDTTLTVQPDARQICIDGVEHGARYDVTFRKGLPAASGDVLHRDVRLTLYVQDRAPSVRFAGRAYVLPRSADAGLPVETVNTDTLELKLRKVSDRNLLRAIQDSYFGVPLNKYQDDQFSDTLAQEIWTGTGDVQNTLNADMTTRLPLGEVLADQQPGIYALSASVPGADTYDSPAATQWFVLTDLGLTTLSGVDGLHATVRGLGDADPRAAVTLSLISKANAVLAEVVTDAQGNAVFPVGTSRGSGSAAPALIVARQGEADIAFLPLTDPAFDLSDRGVEGRPPSPPIDTFLITDRGAYRVGETVHATVLTRDGKATALDGLPLVAVLMRPDGVEYSRTLSQNSRAGGHVFALPLGPNVPRGAWRLDMVADPAAGPLASQTILVEDFLPERIDFALSLPDIPLTLNDTPALTIEARYLFGAPGADLAVEGEVRLSAARVLEGYPGYQFGRYDTRFDRRTRYIEPVQTDAKGVATIPLTLPEVDEMPLQPLSATVTVRVAEGSGRPVERSLSKPILPQGAMIGINPGFDDVLPEAAEAIFDLVATQPLPVRWTLNRVQTQYQWYQVNGNWEWEPITRRIRVSTGDLALSDQPIPLAVAVEWGEYELIVERLGSPYAASSVRFASGWYGTGGDGTATPDRLEISLDSDAYDTGDTVQLRLVAPADGVALISVLSNRVIGRRSVNVREGENLVALEVTEAWGAGAYITASVIRPMNVDQGLNPTRSLGLAHATVRPANRQLSVSIDAPAQMDGQAGSFALSVVVNGVAEGETAYVTLAAVDVGILNLTGFKAPDATGHYFGQRRLGVEIRDIYGRLIDGLNGVMGTVRSGGDAGAAAQLQSPPPTEELMAFFSGPVTVGPDGRAEINVIRPAFNGTIRLMAVAWSETAVGDANVDVVAADPVVVTASLPRLLAPGDQSRLLLELVHAAGPVGDMALEVQARGVGIEQAPKTVAVTEKGTARLTLGITADATGDHQITVALITPDGTRLKKVLMMPVRDNDPEVAVTRQFALAQGETFTFDGNVFAGLRPGTASATLNAGPLARFDVPGLLRQLDRYPYGCTEQVTSSAMPLLYLSGLAEQAGIGAADALDDKIAKSIDGVLANQSTNGAFGLWRAGSGNFWLDAYVTDFLRRAQAEGHAVPARALSQAMENLHNRISYAPDFDNGGEDIAYALLVLARAGAASVGDLRYYADTKARDFATPMAAAQLGAALAAYGDPSRADIMFARAASLLERGSADKGWRDDFGTHLRDAAAVLKLSAEAGSNVIDASALLARFDRGDRTLSTQEAAQMVLAAHALGAHKSDTGLRVDGNLPDGPVIRKMTDKTVESVQIQNSAATPVTVTLTSFGVPQVAPDKGGYGYDLTRSYYTMDGIPIRGSVASGTRLVVVLKVSPFEKTGARLIIDDPLPGGFEIDNPSLLRGGDIRALDWLTPTNIENVEFRSDRFVAAVDYSGADPFTVAYVVRAVTPGSYHHSAATVTDMYRPEYRANTETTALTVTP